MTNQSDTRQYGCRLHSHRLSNASPRSFALTMFVTALFIMLFITMHPSLASADGYRRRGSKSLWIPVNSFEVYEAPKLSYYNQNGQELFISIADIGGFKMTDYPDLEKAEKAIIAKNSKEALIAFQRARRKAKPAWLKLWLDAQLVPLLDKDGKGQEAANAYIALVESGAPSKFLDRPPVTSIATLSKDAKKSMQSRLNKLLGKTKERSPLWFSLKDLIEASDPAAAPVKANGVGTVNQDGSINSAIPMPSFMLTGTVDPITRQLARGSFEAALERVSGEIKATKGGGGRTSMRLYQLALAQYNIAKSKAKSGSAEAKKQLLEANLNFMRVVIYFRNSPYAGPAKMESAAIQIAIGRKDIAAKLLQEAQTTLDPDDEKMAKYLEALSAKTN